MKLYILIEIVNEKELRDTYYRGLILNGLNEEDDSEEIKSESSKDMEEALNYRYKI